MLTLIAAFLLQQLDRIVEDLRSDDIAVRDGAQGRLEEIGPAALPALKRCLKVETDPEVRARLSDAVGVLERRRLAELWKAGRLQEALEQLAALEGAGDIPRHIAGRLQSVREYLGKSRDFNHHWRWTTADLASLGVDRRWTLAVMLELVADRNQDSLHGIALRALLDEGHAITPLVMPLLRHRDPFARQTGCILMGNLRDPDARTELERVCADPDELPEVLRFAREALARCPP